MIYDSQAANESKTVKHECKFEMDVFYTGPIGLISVRDEETDNQWKPQYRTIDALKMELICLAHLEISFLSGYAR